MNYLTIEEVILIHEYELQMHGGAPGIRSIELLESAVYRPKTSFGGNEMFSTIFEKSAVLIHAIIQNHPFIDGNKRTAVVAGIALLKINGWNVLLKQERLVESALKVASGELEITELSNLLKKSSQHHS